MNKDRDAGYLKYGPGLVCGDDDFDQVAAVAACMSISGEKFVGLTSWKKRQTAPVGVEKSYTMKNVKCLRGATHINDCTYRFSLEARDPNFTQCAKKKIFPNIREN